MTKRKLELLAPAKNLECGKAAIDHGADAVYIGAQHFGARAAAGNSVEDIAELCRYAHSFDAKVYVTVNTIIFENEIDDTRRLLTQLSDAGVDAILVQDMGLLSMPEIKHLCIHASTQTDNRTPEKVAWLRNLGFRRVVLARELSLDEIYAIHQAVPDVELEVFVHGALCVSYSGLCYASQECFGRSANRGECAQFCRMKFDLIDADGREIERQRYLLSLKDMCQINNLRLLADAGASSFKIEGRLKSVEYVKNVTSAYSQQLDKIIASAPDKYERASRGHCHYSFTPDLSRTFNRGYTTYFLNGRQPDIASFDTPKAIGQYVGYVKEIRGNSFNVAGTAHFTNGDGLCFINANRELEGFRVNRAENNRLFPMRMPAGLRPGMSLYRNNDQEFERILSRQTSERKIPVEMSITSVPNGFVLGMCETGDDNLHVELTVDGDYQIAEKSQRDNIQRQLSKLGGTQFECVATHIPDDFNLFIPSSQLSEARRQMVEKFCSLMSERVKESTDNSYKDCKADTSSLWKGAWSGHDTFLYNISNHLSRDFYSAQGLRDSQPAFEVRQPQKRLIMQCRHCLRYSLGYCVKRGGKKPTWHEPLYLRLADGRRFQLQFDCAACQMNVIAND